MPKAAGRFYYAALAIVLLASIYPLYMAAGVVMQAVREGYVAASGYPKYVIPYGPICISLCFCTAFLPLFYKRAKGKSLLLLTAFGLLLFLMAEISFEQIKVASDASIQKLEAWQLGLCVATPEVLQALGEPEYVENNPAFKLHFYLIAMVIITTVLGVLHGMFDMFYTGKRQKKRILTVQTTCVVVFIGLCILACFTSFFRTGHRQVPPISAVLMALFFICFGVCFGVYLGTLLHGKGRRFSVLLPSAAAMATAGLMYVGEMVLMDGELYLFGSGWFFSPLGALVLAPVDLLVVLLSGLCTYMILGGVLGTPMEAKGGDSCA